MCCKYLSPVAVDNQQRGVVSGLSLFQLLYLLSQLVLHSLPLLQPLTQLLVLELDHLHVHFLLQDTNMYTLKIIGDLIDGWLIH